MTDSTDNARGPERIWALHNYVAGMTNILSGHIMLEPTEIAETTEYRRADLAPDPLADPRVKLLETRTKEAVETLRKGFKSCDPTKTAAAIILAIAQLEGHGE